jgi:hypothetical protein
MISTTIEDSKIFVYLNFYFYRGVEKSRIGRRGSYFEIYFKGYRVMKKKNLCGF